MNAGGILTAAAPSAVAPVIALVGNPNCGKTALFNALTGSRQKVANYPGVTVEKKIGRLTTPAGRVAADRRPARHLFAARPLARRGDHARRRAGPAAERTCNPDLIVCVGDASNLRLALRLALELKRVGRPVMLSLNMMDIARKRGVEIDLERLSRELGVPVVQSVAVRRGGTDALLGEIDRLLEASARWRRPPTGMRPTPASCAAPSAKPTACCARR